MPESGVIVTREQGGERGALFPSSSVLQSSQEAGWNDVGVERLRLSMDTPEHHHDAHFLTVHLGAPARIEWREGSRHQTARVVPGEFTLIGAGVPHEVRYEGAEVLAVSLAPEMVSRVAQEVAGSTAADRLELITRNSGGSDPQIERIARLLQTEMEAGYPSGRLFGDAIGQALAAHLITHYTSSPAAAPEDAARLSPRQLRQALDFIEENLAGDISLPQIAQAAGLSPFHFARQFKATVGVPPHAYLLERRIERARQLLTGTSLSIAEIAIRVGFANQSHLTRHFRRLTGTTPARFR